MTPPPIPQGSLRSISGKNTWRTGHLKVDHIDTISWVFIKLVFTYAMLNIEFMIFKVQIIWMSWFDPIRYLPNTKKIQYGGQWNNDVISYCCIEIARLDTNTLATSRSQNNCLKCTSSLRKQPTFGDATTGFPAKRRLTKERRNSILMTCHYPDLGSASDWSCRVGNLIYRFSDVIWRENQW